jgi:hypothetical protein
MNMFPKRFYDLVFLKKYAKHFEIKLADTLFRLCDDEYLKLRDTQRDVNDYVKFVAMEMDMVQETQFISLRRQIDRMIFDGNFTNSREAEEGW